MRARLGCGYSFDVLPDAQNVAPHASLSLHGSRRELFRTRGDFISRRRLRQAARGQRQYRAYARKPQYDHFPRRALHFPVPVKKLDARPRLGVQSTENQKLD